MPTNIPIDDIVNVSIDLQAVGQQAPTFNTALIIGSSNNFSGAVRSYTNMQDIAVDFLNVDPEYKAAQTWFSQNPKPSKIYIYQIASAAAFTVNDIDDAFALDDSWYFLTLTKDISDLGTNAADAGSWAEANKKLYGVTTSDATVPTATTTDMAYTIKQLGLNRAVVAYDDNDDYAHLSAFAKIATTNYFAQNSAITLKFKRLPGITPLRIKSAQQGSIRGKNCNYYAYFADTPLFAEGVVSSGKFIDEIHSADWIRAQIQTEVFNFLATRQGKVPQTDDGVEAIIQRVEKVLRAGVDAGIFAPGIWDGVGIGKVNSGDYLDKGFYVYAPSVDTLSSADRKARKCPPIQFIARSAGAIHFADIIGQII